MKPRKPIRKISVIRWAALWVSGDHEHLIFEHCLPVLFLNRRQARQFIHDKYGYILTRKDLRAAPLRWRLPRPIRVKVSMQ